MTTTIQNSPIYQRIFENEPAAPLLLIDRFDQAATQINLHLTKPLEQHLSYAGSALAAVIGTAIKIVALIIGTTATIFMLPALLSCPEHFVSDEDINNPNDALSYLEMTSLEIPYTWGFSNNYYITMDSSGKGSAPLESPKKTRPHINNPLIKQKWKEEIETETESLTQEMMNASADELYPLALRWKQLIEDANLIIFFDSLNDMESRYANRPSLWPTFAPNTNESCAASIRAWMQTNQTALNDVQNLDLQNRGLTKLPAEISLLTDLSWLCIAQNHLKTLPDEIFTLTKLDYLIAQHNEIEAIDPKISNLIHLKELSIHTNPITTIPPLTALTELQNIYLDKDLPSFEHISTLRLNLS